MKLSIKMALLNEWVNQWTNGAHGRAVHKLQPIPHKEVLEKHRLLPRAISSILTQMRTGKISLAHYLYTIGANESDGCSCSRRRLSQTVSHILFDCPKFWDLRRKMLAEREIPHLPDDLAIVLSTPKYAQFAAKFMLKTGLLQQFRAVDSTLGDLTPEEAALKKPPSHN